MLLSEMFGVKRDVDFEVIGYIGRFILREQSDGTERLWWRLKDNKVYVNADLEVLYNVLLKAPSGIIHLPPPLTDEQRGQLKALYTLGYRWLSKSGHTKIYAHEKRPHKFEDNGYWLSDFGSDYYCYMKPSDCFASLVSWSDPEPYDIGKALGVE